MKTLRLLLTPSAAALCVLTTAPGLAATAGSAPPPMPAEDRAELERTRILGQRELPKVLTIVPWKRPLAGAPVTRPLASVLDEALAPVDRDVLRRELHYQAQLRQRALSAKAAGDAAAASAAATAAPQR